MLHQTNRSLVSMTILTSHEIIIHILHRHTHSNDHIVESTALPDQLIRGAGGQIAFEESAVRVNHLLPQHNNSH